MKSYTDLEQSKKLAEILPLESADMYYACGAIAPDIMISNKQDYKCYTVCWSLSALLEIIPQIKLDNIKQYDKKHWRCCAYFASDWHDSDWHYNPIDACYEVILKLNELKML